MKQYLSLIFLFVMVSFFHALNRVSAEETNPGALDSKVELQTRVNSTDSKEPAKPEAKKPKPGDLSPVTSKELRDFDRWNLSGIYAPFDLLIPHKWGMSLAYQRNSHETFEFEYLKGSLSVPFILDDLGGITDQRISLFERNFYSKNSFNLYYGLMYTKVSIKLGSSILDRISGGDIPTLDLLEMQSLGVVFGIGNRWYISNNWTFSLDWASISQPLFAFGEKSDYLDYASDPEDRESVEEAIKVVRYFPRISLFKMQLGYSF